MLSKNKVRKMKTISLQFFLIFQLVVLCGCSSSRTNYYTSFDFHYVSGSIQVNTFNGYLVKDLVKDGNIKTLYSMSASSKEAVLEKLKTIGFFDQPDKISIGNLQSIRVEYNGIEKFASWGGFDSNNEYQTKLDELGRLIVEIAVLSPEFQSLPPARGGRL